jgi:predicted DNA-binding transcriptional regulator AlpA
MADPLTSRTPDWLLQINDSPSRGSSRKSYVTNQYLTTEGVAALLGFAPRTITAWAQQYEDSGGTEGLPAVRFGRRAWRFERSAIELWIARKTYHTVTISVESSS